MEDTVSRYRIGKLLGRGGMGDVYLAQDTRLGRQVALKFLAPELARDADALRRFENEARAAAELSHPHVAAIYDVDQDQGRRFLVLEYVEGETLQKRLQRGPLPLEQVLEIAVALAQALAHAHARGIIHRDIKASNVMLTPEGGIKVLDFGLARRAGESQLTMPGTSLGTISHMSPEQAKGQASDARTDLWALGVVLYECLTGHLPYGAEQPLAVIHQILNEPPRPPSQLRGDVPAELERIVLRCMEKEPSARYQRADELAADLRAVAAHVAGSVAGVGAAATAKAAEATGPLPQPAGLLRELGRRKVVHAALIYAACGYGLVQLIGVVAKRAQVSPAWAELAAVALALLAPAVLVGAWWRGAAASPGSSSKAARTRARRGARTRWGLRAVNVCVAAAVLLVLFRGRDLGGVTTTLAVKDEQGQTTLHVIPKKAYRKQLTVFPFDNTARQASQDWMGYALIDLLALDLQQDPFVTVWHPEHYLAKLQAAGHGDGRDVPRALQRKIAAELFSPFFVTGSVTREGDGWVATTVLHDTEQAQEVATRSFHAPTLFALVDQVSLRLRADLDLPAGHLAEQRDLPVAEMTTSSEDAYRAFTEGSVALWLHNDYKGARPLLEHAVELDPDFALAHFARFVVYANAQDPAKTDAAMEAAMKGMYRLPEPTQFMIKASYYFNVKREPDKALAVSEMWAQLHPDDALAHRQLAVIYALRGQRHESIAEYERILELDPGQRSLLRDIGDTYRQIGEFAKAETYYQRYAAQAPSDARSFSSLAELREDMGKLDAALADAEMALLLEPGDIGTQLIRARLLRRSGRIADATAALQEAIRGSTSPVDVVSAHEARMNHLRFLGQLEAAVKEREVWLREAPAVYPPAQLSAVRLMTLDLLAAAGHAGEAWRQVAQTRDALPPMLRDLVAAGRLRIHLELGNGDSALAYLPGFERLIETFKMEALRPRAAMCAGRAQELRESYKEAIAHYQRVLQIEPANSDAMRYAGICYRALGELDPATDLLQKSLALDPFDPRTNVAMALLLQQKGDRAGARDQVQRALSVWAGADAGFAPAQDARKLLAQLQSSS